MEGTGRLFFLYPDVGVIEFPDLGLLILKGFLQV